MHPEPSCPSPGAVPAFISHLISLAGRLNVSLRLEHSEACPKTTLPAWDTNTKYVMIQHHVPAPVWMIHDHAVAWKISLVQNQNIIFINSTHFNSNVSKQLKTKQDSVQVKSIHSVSD